MPPCTCVWPAQDRAETAMSQPERKDIIHALLLVADAPLTIKRIEELLGEDGQAGRLAVREALQALKADMAEGAVELSEVASGYRLQVRKDFAPWVSRLWDERPQKYSRALLETLALICYRQPLTRGDIEEIRGVSLSANILKTLFERDWIREVGHREGPGRPALLATTRQFLDDMNLKSLDELPSLPELSDPEKLEAALVRLTPSDQNIALELAAAVASDDEQAVTFEQEEDSGARRASGDTQDFAVEGGEGQTGGELTRSRGED